MHKTYQLGDEYPTGGRFVGVSPAGVVWICYGSNEDFTRMVESLMMLEEKA